MPELRFQIRWPNGSVESCYSPSTVIAAHFEVGHSYPMDEFLTRCRRGLNEASERVRLVYGGAGCARAMAQLAALEGEARKQAGEGAHVRVEGFVS